jgi:hypothetical protein
MPIYFSFCFFSLPSPLGGDRACTLSNPRAMVAANHATHLLPRFCLKRDMYQTGEVEVEVRWRWKHDNPHNSLHTLKFIIRVPTNTYITEALIPTRFRAIHSFKFQIVPRPEEGRNHPYLAKRISGGRQPDSLFFCSLKKKLITTHRWALLPFWGTQPILSKPFDFRLVDLHPAALEWVVV